MNLQQHELKLTNGTIVRYEYDPIVDLLEFFFQPDEATCAIELTESLILRFNWESVVPLSLSFIGFSQFTQPTEYGQPYFQLLVDEWPTEARKKILQMLHTAPINEFLHLGSYIPAQTEQIVPMATIAQRPFEFAGIN